MEKGYISYIVSQNIDGLHLRSAIKRSQISELHGNMFIEECNKCKNQFIRSSPVPTVGKKSVGNSCRNKSRPCRGQLFDNILDWEHDLPEDDLYLANLWSTIADLNLCLGTTLQILPSGNLPLKNKRHGGKVVICNLQPTKNDKKADLLIHTYVDSIFERVLKRLGIEEIPEYDKNSDPVKNLLCDEWTISSKTIKEVEVLHKQRLKDRKSGGASLEKDAFKNVKKRKIEENFEKDKKENLNKIVLV